MPVLVLPLRNGLELTITGEPTLRALANFLKAAIVHFKNQRDIQQVTRYTAGSFQGRVAGGDCAISYPGDGAGNHLPPAAWAEAVLDLYRRTEALDEIRQRNAGNRETTGEQGANTTAGLLEQTSPAPHLEALRISLEQRQR